MKLVIDTNIIISTLIKDSLTRKLITNINFDLFLPSFSLSEIKKYENYICKKAGFSRAAFNKILQTIFENIEIVPYEFYKDYLKEAEKLIIWKDVPFLALALALKADGIWSDDKHFEIQNRIKIFKTKDLARKFLKQNKKS